VALKGKVFMWRTAMNLKSLHSAGFLALFGAVGTKKMMLVK